MPLRYTINLTFNIIRQTFYYTYLHGSRCTEFPKTRTNYNFLILSIKIS